MFATKKRLEYKNKLCCYKKIIPNIRVWIKKYKRFDIEVLRILILYKTYVL